MKNVIVTKATVLQVNNGIGQDICILTTTLPFPFSFRFPTEENSTLSLRFEASPGKGPSYIKENFGLDADVIDYK